MTSNSQVFLSGDFENATDNLEHEVAYEIAKTFLGLLGYWSDYMQSAFRLLLSPRRVDDSTKKKEIYWVTQRGILMGEPLTKGILTLIGFVASRTPHLPSELNLRYGAPGVTFY
jgi:hypothetical protein